MRASSGVIPLILMTAAAILPNGGVHLPLSPLAWLLVVPVLAQIRENTGLLALLLEALEGPLEVLIVVDDDFRQLTCSSRGARGKCIEALILCTDLNRCQEWKCRRSTGVSAALSGRPLHVPTADDVNVDVKHRLSGVLVGVDDRPIAGLVDAFLSGDLDGREEQLAEELRIVRVVERGDVLPGNHQHMCWRLRI